MLEKLKELGVTTLLVANNEAMAVNPYDNTPNRLFNSKWKAVVALPPLPTSGIPDGPVGIEEVEEEGQFRFRNKPNSDWRSRSSDDNYLSWEYIVKSPEMFETRTALRLKPKAEIDHAILKKKIASWKIADKRSAAGGLWSGERTVLKGGIIKWDGHYYKHETLKNYERERLFVVLDGDDPFAQYPLVVYNDDSSYKREICRIEGPDPEPKAERLKEQGEEPLICPVTKEHCNDNCRITGLPCNLEANQGEEKPEVLLLLKAARTKLWSLRCSYTENQTGYKEATVVINQIDKFLASAPVEPQPEKNGKVCGQDCGCQSNEDCAFAQPEKKEEAICSHHNPLNLSYLQWHNEAERRTKQKRFQTQCEVCKRWFWKDEIGKQS